MIPVNKYVDMEHPQFKGKNDFELWEMLTDSLRFMIAIEYLGVKIDESITELAKNIGNAVLAMKKEECSCTEETTIPVSVKKRGRPKKIIAGREVELQ